MTGALAPLFEPLRLNAALTLKNRIVLAPCTRNRATADLSPTEGALAHYASRADAGLLITEATLVCRETQGYRDTPGIYTDAHVRAWARVTDAVHQAGGLIFLQLWHTGRMAHSHYGGVQPVAPSAVFDAAARRQVGTLQLYNEAPRAMNEADIAEALAQYGTATRRAREAGFDGVEIHGANGYLPEQFLRLHTNRRDDAWGGAAKNRARFAVECFEACAREIGAQRTGIRLSPAAYFSEMVWTDGDNEALDIALQTIDAQRPAYIHTGIVEDAPVDYLGGTSSAYLRQRIVSPLIGNGGYEPADAARKIADGAFDLIAFGKLFLANADLVAKLRTGAPLKPYSRAVLDTFA